MPIAPLPRHTIRALGSAQVLTSPVSVVKELVENSLDAGATSISVEISSNTLDTIQVSDNGHGVAPQDRENLAKRYHTSKLQHLSELRTLGGRTLGFRGEALASAAEVAGALTVITRVEDEVVGSRMTFGRTGEISM